MIENKKKKNIRKFLVLCLFLSGLSTLLPYDNVLHPSLLGYKALCPFIPMSTAILWGLAGFLFLQPIRMRNRKPVQGFLYLFSMLLFAYGMAHSGYLGMIGLLSWETDVFLPLSLEKIADGFYTGKSNNIGKKVVMKVEVKDKKMVAIQTISMGHASIFGEEAFKHLPDRILKAQSLKVDTVSGASHSCKQIQAAIYNAFQPKSQEIERKKKKRFARVFSKQNNS